MSNTWYSSMNLRELYECQWESYEKCHMGMEEETISFTWEGKVFSTDDGPLEWQLQIFLRIT